MVVLTIQPVVYQDNLDELGIRIIRIFDPIVGSFVVNREKGLGELDNSWFHKPEKAELEGDKFIEYLRELGELVLGVTSLNIRAKVGDPPFYPAFPAGGLEGIAFVSTYYLHLRSQEALTKAAAHEVGHGLGLRDHPCDVKTQNGLSCLMVYELGSLIWRPITTNQAYEVEYGFCESCYKQLMEKHMPQLVME